ncbi:MAG: glycosyltransferase family 25 protein [Alphaproteobacteria bacterium]|nr:MAG: glycosyltransferase family 25 protein [Alphaproteobacteria bacterium]
MKSTAFIIHLGRAAARRRQVEKIRAALPVPAEILAATDGAALGASERKAVLSEDPLFAPPYPFALGPGEIGCFLSHRRAWKAIVERGLDAALIIEDDVEISTAVFSEAFRLAARHVGRLGYVQFQTRPLSGRGRVIDTAGEARLVVPEVAPLRTSAQLVSRAAAKRLLECSERIDRPVDCFLQLRWVTGIAPAVVEPSGVADRTAEAGGSTISRRRRLPERLRHEILRPIYRWRIARASRRAAASPSAPGGGSTAPR